MTNQDKSGIAQYDSLERWRCPMLGGPVHFGYCRTVNDGLPCARVLECWIQTLPLVEFLKANYRPEDIQRALNTKPKGRLDRMKEAVENASQVDPPETDA
ncbi:MAG: hypothetical protein JW889_03570 [Verrucomicrobia bacterium]|nr:hypothetical protein [Verrucomicrobiota bacterium]